MYRPFDSRTCRKKKGSVEGEAWGGKEGNGRTERSTKAPRPPKLSGAVCCAHFLFFSSVLSRRGHARASLRRARAACRAPLPNSFSTKYLPTSMAGTQEIDRARPPPPPLHRGGLGVGRRRCFHSERARLQERSTAGVAANTPAAGC